MGKTIRAVRCHRFAATDENARQLESPLAIAEVLSQDEIPAPVCGADQVLIETHYAGIQYPDTLQAMGLYQDRPPLPYVPGMDATGIVLQVGSNVVSDLKKGDRVIAQTRIGALAEQVAVDANSVWRIPDGVQLQNCANLGRNFFAAYHSLKVVGEIEAGDLVLVDGASGGVGMAAIQLAKAMGAKVIAGVSVPAKQSYPQEAGADRVFCYGTDRASYREFKSAVREAAKELGHPQGVDLVVDMVQGELFEAALVSCVRPLGKLALVGFTAGQQPIRPGILLIKQAAAIGSLWGPWAKVNPDQHQQHVAEILHFIASGAIQPTAARIFEFEDAIRAFELFENNQGRGNTVVKVK